ncbi:unannotated protein [freshwater metagenome]|uniref:Unannotated protein n=1 Tax=freshwater metagenome TaxID=449393 RepID=A0A6J6AR77_9ZZZZ
MRRAAISRWTTNGFAVFTILSTRSRMRRNFCQKSCFTPSSLTINRKRVNVERSSHWRCSPTHGALCPTTAFSGPRVAQSPQRDSKMKDSTFVKEVDRERSVSRLRAVTISKRWNWLAGSLTSVDLKYVVAWLLRERPMTTCRFRISVKERRFSSKKATRLLKFRSTKLKPVSIRALSSTSRSIRLIPTWQMEYSCTTASTGGVAPTSPTFSTSKMRSPIPPCCCLNRTIAQRKQFSTLRTRSSTTTCRAVRKNSGPKQVLVKRSSVITPMTKPMKHSGSRIS